MPIDENIKRNIRDLYFDQYKTIRELAKITRKSSRDIIAVIKVSGKENAEENKHQNKKKDTEYDFPLILKPTNFFLKAKASWR